MSGGVYNYLFTRIDTIEERRTDIGFMAERLEASGYYAAARATRNVLVLLDAVQAVADGLTDVWKAVEWADSGDCNEDQVREAVRGFAPLLGEDEEEARQ